MHAVHFAAKYKTDTLRKKVVAGIAYLVRHGANLNLADECGDTAFGLALKLRQKDIAKLMLIHGANFPSRIN
jgi:ankyrin repeat protein